MLRALRVAPRRLRRRSVKGQSCSCAKYSRTADDLETELMLRDTVRKFVDTELLPHVDEWEAAREFPRELYKRAGDLGLLQLGFDSPFLMMAVQEELCRTGAGGLVAGLSTHFISMPPILKMGSPDLIERVAKPVLAGDKIGALAVTEPGAGSDVASISTVATLDSSGDHFVINGEKTFITSGMRADYYTVVARTPCTGDNGSRNEISLIVVEREREGFTRTKLEKMGWHCSDTATLHFDNVKVPKENVIGEIGSGFQGLMLNFNSERLMLATQATAFSQVAFEEARDWAQQRSTFGAPLISRQVIRHKLVDMASAIATCRAFLTTTAEKAAAARSASEQAEVVADICMLKNHCTTQMEFVATNAVQILGGMGFVSGSKSERIFRETKVQQIGGGSTEIMKDLAARQLGFDVPS